MTDRDYSSNYHPNGYMEIYAILPPGPPPDEIDEILFSIDCSVQSISEPPIASVNAAASIGPKEEYDDSRGFFVNFESNATYEQFVEASKFIADAFVRVREKYPDAGQSK